MSLKTFTDAYLEAALWSSTAYGAPEDTGEGNWDTSFESYGCDESDLAPETLAKMESDCRDFYESAGDMLAEWSDEQAGHDFWLTRNGHGAGFWDRGLPMGDKLSELARPYGAVTLYFGDPDEHGEQLIYAS